MIQIDISIGDVIRIEDTEYIVGAVSKYTFSDHTLSEIRLDRKFEPSVVLTVRSKR